MKKHYILLIILIAALSAYLCAGCGISVNNPTHSVSASSMNETDNEFKISINDDSGAIALSNETNGALPSIDEAYYYENTNTFNDVDTTAEINAITGASPALSTVLAPKASGTTVYANSKACIDASNSEDGYVMIKYTGSAVKIKVLIDCPDGTRYIYDLNSSGTYEVYPLSDGNGAYTIGVYENVYGTKYAVAYTTRLDITLSDQFAPFLRPNQYVNFSADSQTAAQAAELCRGMTNALDKVNAVYNYIISNFTYDKALAASVQSGYLPDLDSVLAKKKGICFDYAALMTAMLRCQNVPTKLVVGYSGSAYHAWINTYVDGQGWVNGVIYFDGQQWKLMDPTYASSAKSSAAIMQYINNSSNYTAKYLY